MLGRAQAAPDSSPFDGPVAIGLPIEVCFKIATNQIETMDIAPSLAADEELPLVVDLDHTLVRTDTLHEQAVRMVFRAPQAIPGTIAALTRGRAALKAHVAGHIELDPEALPFREDLLRFIRAEKAKGRTIVLCTAATGLVAESIGAHLGLFDTIIASDGTGNLKGKAKAARLQAEFPRGFVYAGDSGADLAVWQVASGIVLVGVSSMVARRARRLDQPVLIEFGRHDADKKPRSMLNIWAKALRVHHWSKNGLMLVPLILAHLWGDIGALTRTLTGLVLLLVVTSSSYLINDLSDLDADRKHWTKRLRPLASGAIPILQGALVACLALPMALLCGFLLSLDFGLALSAYLVITLAYSFGLKRIPLLDTFIIAILFTTRLIMGMALLQQPYSEWLVTFSMFFFFSLALAKRHVEVLRSKDFGDGSLKTRGYVPEDAGLTLALGVAGGIGSLVIMVLYLVEDALRRETYTHPVFLWLLPLALAVWIGRVWLLAHRGLMSDDPVSFALRDKASLGLGVLVALGFVLAL